MCAGRVTIEVWTVRQWTSRGIIKRDVATTVIHVAVTRAEDTRRRRIRPYDLTKIVDARRWTWEIGKYGVATAAVEKVMCAAGVSVSADDLTYTVDRPC